MVLYIETPEASGDLCDFYIDNVQVSMETPVPEETEPEVTEPEVTEAETKPQTEPAEENILMAFFSSFALRASAAEAEELPEPECRNSRDRGTRNSTGFCCGRNRTG